MDWPSPPPDPLGTATSPGALGRARPQRGRHQRLRVTHLIPRVRGPGVGAAAPARPRAARAPRSGGPSPLSAPPRGAALIPARPPAGARPAGETGGAPRGNKTWGARARPPPRPARSAPAARARPAGTQAPPGPPDPRLPGGTPRPRLGDGGPDADARARRSGWERNGDPKHS